MAESKIIIEKFAIFAKFFPKKKKNETLNEQKTTKTCKKSIVKFSEKFSYSKSKKKKSNTSDKDDSFRDLCSVPSIMLQYGKKSFISIDIKKNDANANVPNVKITRRFILSSVNIKVFPMAPKKMKTKEI